MNRSTLRLCVLGLVLLAAPTAFARVSDDQMKELIKAYNQAQQGDDQDKKIQTVARLGEANHPDAVKVLIKIIGTNDPAIDGLVAERAASLQEIEKWREKIAKMVKQGATVSQGEYDRFQKVIREQEERAAAVDKKLTTIYFTKYTAIEALYKISDRPALDLMVKELANPKWEVRVGILTGLGKSGAADADAAAAVVEGVRKAIDDKDSKVQSAAIDAAAALRDKDAEDKVIAQLKNKAWQARISAIYALARFRSAKGIPAMIDALQTENGRMQYEIDGILEFLTGSTFAGDGKQWKAWLEGNKDKLDAVIAARMEALAGEEGDGLGGGSGSGSGSEAGSGSEPPKPAKPRPPRKTAPSFYDMMPKSKNCCFVVQASKGMSEKSGRSQRIPNDWYASTGPILEKDYPKGGTKLDLVNFELTKAIRSLPEDAMFNIVHFNTQVSVYSPGKMVKATSAAKQGTIDWLATAYKAELTSNIFDALETAFYLQGPKIDVNYAKGVDTIYFLSDGMMDHGRVRDPAKIVTELSMLNITRKIRVNVIAVGKDNDSDISFLYELSQRNGGSFLHRE